MTSSIALSNRIVEPGATSRRIRDAKNLNRNASKPPNVLVVALDAASRASIDAHRARGRNQLSVDRDQLGLSHRLFERHAQDHGPAERDEATRASLRAEIRGLHAEACAEQSVEGRGRSTALHVAEHRHADLVLAAVVEERRELLAGAAEAGEVSLAALGERERLGEEEALRRQVDRTASVEIDNGAQLKERHRQCERERARRIGNPVLIEEGDRELVVATVVRRGCGTNRLLLLLLLLGRAVALVDPLRLALDLRLLLLRLGRRRGWRWRCKRFSRGDLQRLTHDVANLLCHVSGGCERLLLSVAGEGGRCLCQLGRHRREVRQHARER